MSDDQKIHPFTISRVFDISRDLAFEVWTQASHMQHWSSSAGGSIQFSKFNLHPQGVTHYCMIGADGSQLWGKIVYEEIIKPKEILYSQFFSDQNEGVTRHPMAPTWPPEMQTSVIFEEVGRKTKITLTWTPVNPTPEELATFNSGRAGMSAGWNGSFNQLETYLKSLKKS